MAQVRRTRVDETRLKADFSEKEVEEILAQEIIKVAQIPDEMVLTKVRLLVDNRDGSTGPYRVYQVEVVVEGELSNEQADQQADQPA